MMSRQFSHQQLVSVAKLSIEDRDLVYERRRPYTRLGFAYQLAFVRLANRFPAQRPTLEIEEEVLAFVSVQLDLPVHLIQTYAQYQSTLSLRTSGGSSGLSQATPLQRSRGDRLNPVSL
jgi:hypothetical protein